MIYNTLSIDVKSNCCFLIEKMPDAYVEGFRRWKKFYEFIHNMRQLKADRIPFKKFLDFFEEAVRKDIEVWFWPTLEGDSLFTFMRNNCLRAKESAG